MAATALHRSVSQRINIAHSGLHTPCGKDTEFNALVQRRQRRWKDGQYIVRRGLWQAAIDDKILGFVFARKLGIVTPDVLFCHSKGYSMLPEAWPRTWGCCFVIKPLYGFNDVTMQGLSNPEAA